MYISERKARTKQIKERKFSCDYKDSFFKELSFLLVMIFSYFSSINFRISSLVLLIFAVILVIFDQRCVLCFESNILVQLEILIIIISCFGLFYTTDSAEGIRFFLRIFLCFFYSVMIETDVESHGRIVKFMYFGALCSVTFTYVQLLFPNIINSLAGSLLKSEAFSVTNKLYTLYGTCTGLSGYTSVAGFAAAILGGFSVVYLITAVGNKKIGNIVINVVLLFLSIYAIILANKRSLFLAALFASLVILVSLNVENRRVKYSLLIGILCIGFLSFYVLQSNEVVIEFLNRFQSGDGTDLSTGRMTIYSELIDKLDGRWFWGYGTGSAASEFDIGGGVHNIYLQLIFENGVFIFVAWAFLFYLRLRRSWGSKKNGFNGLTYMSIYVQIIFLIYGLFGNPLYDEPIFFMYCLFSSLGISSNRGVTEEYE